jgi:hypothetical protein
MAAGLLTLGLVLTGCGGVDFDAATMTQFEARWMCDVQRTSFEDVEAMTGALTERLTGNGLTPGVYASFKDALTRDEALRDQVGERFDVYCDLG